MQPKAGEMQGAIGNARPRLAALPRVPALFGATPTGGCSAAIVGGPQVENEIRLEVIPAPCRNDGVPCKGLEIHRRGSDSQAMRVSSAAATIILNTERFRRGASNPRRLNHTLGEDLIAARKDAHERTCDCFRIYADLVQL